MKNLTYFKLVLIFFFFSFGHTSLAQTYKPFSVRENIEVRGSMLVIGNSILGKDNQPFNDTSKDNQDVSMQYIDIDNDNSTFSSSSADIKIPTQSDGSPTTCYRVAYAALYWGASLQSGSRTSINKVKFKIPGSTTYTDITGELIYDAIVNPIIAKTNEPGNTPYACYANVTNLFTGLTDIEGTYALANVTSSTGLNFSTGLSAGWTLFIIYEDPNLHTKSFTTFDGFSHVFDGHDEVVPVTGFTTPPGGHIDLQFAYATLDGDRTKRATKLEINGKEVTTPLRTANKFFGSVIENTNGVSTPRNPFSLNTLGYDTGSLKIINSEPEYIKNNDTSATFVLQVAPGQADPIFAFFAAFGVDVISPNIDIIKIVVDEFGNEINGDNVFLGQNLFYEISYQNTGNDNVTGFTITDVLPDNIIFDPLTDIDLSNAGGATLQSYDPTTRTLVFSVPDGSVEVGDPEFVIRLAVQIVPNCYDLSQACSNEIINQAFATYTGVLSTIVIDEQGSYSTTECFGNPQPTNFLVDISNCNFQRTEVLCGSSVILTAAAGYDSYSWSNSPSGSPVIGTGQTYTATEAGTYYVKNVTTSTCISIEEVITVVLFGNTQTNPVIPYADEVVVCPNDGKLLPYIFLCGSNDVRNIITGISDAASIIWEKLDESSCPAVVDQDCANEDTLCNWNQVGVGPNFVANTSGQFKLTINYPGGCFSVFYFNVYQNLLNPTVTAQDIICTTPGSITVGSIPSGYEFSIDGVNYQSSNVFTINSQGFYIIYIRQVGVDTNPCIFQTPNVFVRQRDFTVTSTVTQPECHGGKGRIHLAANDALPQYYFSIYESGTLVNSVGPIMASDFQFSSLNAGTYTVNVRTDDGCFYEEVITIVEPPLLTVTAALTSPLTCNDGEITVYPVGGTPPYLYYVNSTTVFQDSEIINVSAAGVYNITVVDTNNCSATTTITVEGISPPEFNITKTNILCASSSDTGAITINVTNTNGNTLVYSIDGGVTFSNSPVFAGLAAGNYDVVVQYTIGEDICLTDPQTITITVNSPIVGTPTLTTPYTCTTSGIITVTSVSGGTPPYSYSIDGVNFQSGNTFSGLTNGTYTITVQDTSECPTIVGQITIDSLNPPTDLMFSSSALTCPTNTSTITITGTTGGVPVLEYQIIAPAAAATAYQTSNVFAGLAPGTYTFQVKDANDCIYNESYTITPLAPITVVGQSINDITCFGASDGSVQFTVAGSTGFSYTINGGASVSGTSPVVLTGISAGTYTILVTDSTTNCEVSMSAIVNGPSTALNISTTVSPITCSNSGSVTINATGGWGGNTYSLTLPDATVLPAQSNNTFGNLNQGGTYTVTVVDANGCMVTETFDLIPASSVIASISSTSDVCYGSNGATIDVIVTSGEAPYEYSINGGAFQSGNSFTNLVPGTYVVTVRDAYGCTVTISAETIEPQLILNTVLTKGLDCTASPDAIITGTIAGGSAPYTYSVSFNSGTYTSLGTSGNPFTYSTGSPGTYQFQITDAQGCTAQSGMTTINPISLPELNVIAQTRDIACNGDANGAIQVTYNSAVGTPPFLINVFNDTSGVDYGTQTTSLPAGTYTITLTDAKSCTDTDTIVIGEPDPLNVDYHTVDITCTASGISQGSIIIDGVTGGTAPYNYYVTGTNGYSNSELNSTGSTSVTFDVVDFGLYQINVVDAKGCSVLIQDVLVASPPTDLDIIITSTVDCLLGGEAVISIGSSLPSAGPFFFSIYQGPSSVYPNPPGSWIPEDALGSQTATFTGLTAGVLYTFIVYDASTNCSYYEPATTPIPTNSSLTASAISANNITCTGSADGSITFTVNSIYGAPTDISYEIFDSLSLVSTGISGSGTVPGGGSLVVSDLGPLPFGNYYVLINETSGPNSGCGIVTVPFNITESAIPLNLSVTVEQNANCNLNSGVISAVASNGTLPYQYQITTTPASPLATDLAWASTSTFNMDAGSYYVHVLDAYGCVVSSPVTVLPMDPSPVITASVNNECTAVEGSFEIAVALSTPGIPPYSISIDGGTFQTQTLPLTISNLSSGNHSVEIKDANGCGNLVMVTIQMPLGLSPSVTALPSCTNDDGIITLSTSGGTGSYSYAISPNPASIVLSGNVFSGVPSGTYTITVTDTVTLCSEDVSVTLDAATPVTFTTTVTDASCNGDNNGVIIVNLPASNDNPVYTYEITAPILVPAQNSNIFTGLPAGTYTVLVTSGRGCILAADVIVGEPVILQASGTATDFECALDNSVNTSTLTITEAGGTAPYMYSINGTNYFTNNTFEIIDNGSLQTLSIYVRDANGCIATNTVAINPLPTLTLATVAVATPIDCNDTGTVAISVTGGSGNYTYQMLPSGTPQASNIFTITSPGDYFFRVNDVGTGCNIATLPITVAPFDSMEVLVTAYTPVNCFGDSNGALEINISGFYTGNYTYEVFDNSGTSVGGVVNANSSTNPQIVTGIPAGNYTVVVTQLDSPFCSTTSNMVTIVSPATPLELIASETSNVTCTDDQGTITAIGSGGTAPYEYELTGAATVGYSTNGSFTNLSEGLYVVNVRDAGGCIASDTVTLVIPSPINATFTANTTLLSCFGDSNATITVSNVTGGQGVNYTYTLNRILPTANTSGPQTSPVFTGLAAGTYSVSVNDAFSCSLTSVDIVITEPSPINASLVTATTQTCLTEATLTLSATGGTGPYEYSNNSGFTTVLGSFASSTTFSVPVGTHVYYVRDASGCVANVSNAITIDALPPLTLNLDATNAVINCTGDNTGVIFATAQGGLGNYIYTLQDALGNAIPSVQASPGVFTELVAGTYYVKVDSGDCATTTSPITITEPSAPLEVSFNVTNVICFGGDNGAIVINATGGTGIIKYAISPQLNQFFETNTFENLAPGQYEVVVQDVLGCYVNFNFTISEPPPVILSIVPSSLFPEVCEGDNEGEFSITISGGTAPYSVSLDDYNGTYTTGSPGQTQFDFTGLGGGDHSVFVRDSLGCESEWNITFPESVRINPIVQIEYACVDNASNNSVSVVVDESITDLSEVDYSLDGGPYQVSNIFTNIVPGVGHYIDVRHTNGCIVRTELFDITDFEPLALVLNEGGLNEIIAVTTGGSEPYDYTLNGESYGATNSFMISQSGTYTVTVSDLNGCVATASLYLEFTDICIPNYFTPNADGISDGWAPGCTENYPNLEVDIFDRYGRKVAVLRIGEFWDGKYNGYDLPTGDYWYVVNLNDPSNGRDFVGHFTLYR